jgi:hypothetical protein
MGTVLQNKDSTVLRMDHPVDPSNLVVPIDQEAKALSAPHRRLFGYIYFIIAPAYGSSSGREKL